VGAFIHGWKEVSNCDGGGRAWGLQGGVGGMPFRWGQGLKFAVYGGKKSW